MGRIEEQLARLRQWNAEISPVENELVDGALAFTQEAFAPPPSDEAALVQESIVMRRRRPVLAIKSDTAELQFEDEADVALWRGRLERAMPHIKRAASAVGRIDLAGGPLDWIGTGWLVSENVLVTNRHVAQEFAHRDGTGFTFSPGTSGPVSAFADFLQEIDSSAQLRFDLLRPLHIETASGPDVAFFEIAQTSGDRRIAEHLTLAQRPRITENAAVIGYPAYDSRIPEPELMERIYGRVYNKKRLAPGAVTQVEAGRLLHNCTTLGGNSGSLVLDLDTGEALGLHYSGSFLTSNYAVRADVVGQLLEDVRSGRTRSRRDAGGAPVADAGSREQPAVVVGQGQVIGQVTLPITITISAGQLTAISPTVSGFSYAAPVLPGDSGPDDVEGEEGRIEDYRGRSGYVPGFLGVEVPLPKVERDAADVLTFDVEGKTEDELRYEHYSVVMSRSRRMCFFSAVNISGRLSKKSKRGPWRWDPRLPREQQIMKECYGNPPRFSRGHMTRREDPGWGDEQAVADRGNQDSMHVTNATPQMQAFNSPIWLALEDYALDHARSDKMDISVFTGPYFRHDDPVMYGVRIPVTFWKIIAFIHDDTRKLCATGYELNQSKSLATQEEFIFGQFVSPQLGMATQVPVAAIAQRSGISFDPLVKHDPLSVGAEASESRGARRLLMTQDHIRFLA